MSDRARVRTRITPEPIEIDELGEQADGAGASVLFIGRVRPRNEGREVVGLEYDAYDVMADTVLREIANEASTRFGASRVDAVHRTGRLGVGEISVAIAVAAPHRAESYEASRYVIEEIKKRLPVWKREIYADGSEAWLDGTPLSGADVGKDGA